MKIWVASVIILILMAAVSIESAIFGEFWISGVFAGIGLMFGAFVLKDVWLNTRS